MWIRLLQWLGIVSPPVPSLTPPWSPEDTAAVRKVLLRDWNPINVGGLPEDEYDAYIPEIRRIIEAREGWAALSDYLRRVELDWIGCVTTQHRRDWVAKFLYSNLTFGSS